jgi:flagellar L-ring protein precursor FlgH
MKKLSSHILMLAMLVLAGCVAPSSTIKTPLTARAPERDAAAPHNGAIFQAGKNEHPLFEDRRPRNVGDTLTINIIEAINATQSASNSTSHAGSFAASTPTITKGATVTGGATPSSLLAPFNIADSSTGSLADKSANAGANNFTGTLSVTVIEVMPNGNLLVGGEKQMSINQDDGYIRFSGVVDPMTISTTTSSTSNTVINTVQSYQVADVHIEYKDSNDNIDASQVMSMFGRAFRSILPF